MPTRASSDGGIEGGDPSPVKKDIRRHYCPYCGICRSKKALIASHVASEHQDESNSSSADNIIEAHKRNTCEECGTSFRKPAHLKQHMLVHSVERPFSCPVDDCRSSYQRKDHLTRHLCSHHGKLFTCPHANCDRQFVFQANMKRHINKFHTLDKPCDEGKLFTCPQANCNRQFTSQANMKKHIKKFHTLDTLCNEGKSQYHRCPEAGCGKSYKYLSMLKKHQKSHDKRDSVETKCCMPGCNEYFSNAACMKAHVRSRHSRVLCPDCGTYQIRRNIKRHRRIHEDGQVEEKTIKCSYDGCSRMFINKSNLNAHVKAVHLQRRPFACRKIGCAMRFTFRHVRDNHERRHTYVRGNFLEADLEYRSRSRGGRKRKFEGVDALLRKRVSLPCQEHVLDCASEYMSWLLGGNGALQMGVA